jgi:hypothetical protein
MSGGPNVMSNIRVQSVAAVYGAWLVGIFGVFYLAHGRDDSVLPLQLILIAGMIPAGLQLLFLKIDWRGLVAPVKFWLALLLVILLSYVVNGMDPRTAPSGSGVIIPAAWTPMVYIFDTLFVMWIATLVSACSNRELMRLIGSFYCVFAAPFLIYIDFTGEMLWGRLVANDLQPNNWGLMGLTACLAAFARKPDPIAMASFVSGAYTMLIASSREHELALVVVVLVVAALYLEDLNRSRLVAVLVASAITLIIAAIFLDPYILSAIQYISSDVLLVDSPDRGVDSGFTGRTGVWAATLDVWMKSPLFGVGFREHERFLNWVPAHNAYLAMLADTGLVGLILYVVLLISSLVASWGMKDARSRRFVLTTILGYIVIGFFDRRAINAGNPYGLLILMCCSVALVDQSLRRAVRSVMPPDRPRELALADPPVSVR